MDKALTADQVRACVLTLIMTKMAPAEGLSFTTEEVESIANADHRLIVRFPKTGGVHVRLMTAEDAMWLDINGTLPGTQ